MGARRPLPRTRVRGPAPRSLPHCCLRSCDADGHGSLPDIGGAARGRHVMTAILTLFSGGLVGFTLGLIGGGGSILATPLLLYVVGVRDPHVAIGTSAFAVSMNAFAN